MKPFKSRVLDREFKLGDNAKIQLQHTARFKIWIQFWFCWPIGCLYSCGQLKLEKEINGGKMILWNSPCPFQTENKILKNLLCISLNVIWSPGADLIFRWCPTPRKRRFCGALVQVCLSLQWLHSVLCTVCLAQNSCGCLPSAQC